MSIDNKIPNIIIDWRCVSWSGMPGGPILHQESFNVEKAKKVFAKFISETIPLVRNLIEILIKDRQISEVHLPMTLFMIFFTHLEELVEHYQNQLDERDENIDKQVQEIKSIFAKEDLAIFSKNFKQLHSFVSEIKNKLILTDTLVPRLNETFSVWEKILINKHVGNIALIALYDQNVRRTQVNGTDFSFIKMSRKCLMQSFEIALHQLSKDFKWISTKIKTQMAEPMSQDLENALNILSESNNAPLEEDFRMKFKNFETEANHCLHAIYMLNLNDRAAVEAARIAIDQVRQVALHVSDFSSPIRSLNEGHAKGAKINICSTATDKKMAISPEFFPTFMSCLGHFQELIELIGVHLVFPFIQLDYSLEALHLSSENWEKSAKKKTKLPLAPEVHPILQTIINCDDLLKELEADTPSTKAVKGKPQPQKKPLAKKTKKPQAKKEQKPVLKTEPKSVNKPLPAKTPLPQISYVEHLKMELIALHQANPSRNLRQALVHLDFLIAFQNSLKSHLADNDCLTYANAVIYSAQKLIEQTYRFVLKKENASLTGNHNLKLYHREYDPAFTEYPPIVKELYLANDCRYFYIHHHRLHSATTHTSLVPPVLDTLVEIAEGKPLTPANLKELIDQTIQKSCAHVETLLEPYKVSTDSILSVPQTSIKLTEFLNPKVFDTVNQTLKDFLPHFESHNLAKLYIKQALAAHQMLKASLAEINVSKDTHGFSTWTTLALQHSHDLMENVLHAIEFLQDFAPSIQHELKDLTAKVGLEMGEFLEDAYLRLHNKTRYPAELLIDSFAASIIDDLEALKQQPDILSGFVVQNLPKLLWTMPGKDASPDAIAAKVSQLMASVEEFLKTKALPALQSHLPASIQ